MRLDLPNREGCLGRALSGCVARRASRCARKPWNREGGSWQLARALLTALRTGITHGHYARALRMGASHGRFAGLIAKARRRGGREEDVSRNPIALDTDPGTRPRGPGAGAHGVCASGCKRRVQGGARCKPGCASVQTGKMGDARGPHVISTSGFARAHRIEKKPSASRPPRLRAFAIRSAKRP
jgi:hypothetical protein